MSEEKRKEKRNQQSKTTTTSQSESVHSVVGSGPEPEIVRGKPERKCARKSLCSCVCVSVQKVLFLYTNKSCCTGQQREESSSGKKSREQELCVAGASGRSVEAPSVETECRA